MTKAQLRSTFPLTVVNNIVCFNSIAEYNDVLDIWPLSEQQDLVNHLNAHTSYESLGDVYTRPTDWVADTMYNHDFITTILNKNNIVRIGNHFIRVKKEVNSVSAVEANCSPVTWTNFVNGYSDANVFYYKSTDDILTDLQENHGGYKTTLCSQSGIAGVNSPVTNNVTVGNINGTTYTFKGRGVYNQWGIFNTLYFEVQLSPGANGITDMRINLPNLMYKQRCGNQMGPVTLYNLIGGQNSYKKYQSYQGSKNLNKLCYSVYFSIYDLGSTYNSNTVSVQKNCSN